MIQYICESCAMVKNADDPWILGLAAEALGAAGARREVSIFPGWDPDRAVHPLAVHFCSLACKNKYLAKLFGDETLKQQARAERSLPDRLPDRGRLAIQSRNHAHAKDEAGKKQRNDV